MSAVIETFIICDVCGNSHGVDNRHLNVMEQRKSAKDHGWRYSGGIDYCPNCKKRKEEPIPPIYQRLNKK